MNGAVPRPVWSGRVRLAVLASVVLVAIYGAGKGGFVADGVPAVREFLFAATSPDVDPEFLRLILNEVLVTVAFALLGTLFGTTVGFVAALLTADGLASPVSHRTSRVFRSTMRVLVAFPRGTHEVAVALLLVNILGANPLVAVLAIGIPFGAVTATVFASFLDEAAAVASYRALRASGAPRTAAVWYSAIPRALPNMVSYGFYRFECSLRSATVLGFVGAGGIGTQFVLSFASLRWNQIWSLVYTLIILGAFVDGWSSIVRRRLRSVQRVGAWGWGSFGALGIGGLSAVWWLEINPATLWSSRARDLSWELVSSLVRPVFADGLIMASFQSLSMATLAVGGAFVFSTVAAFVVRWSDIAVSPVGGLSAGGRVVFGCLSVVSRGVLLVFRVIPPPLWVLLSVFVVKPGVWPGVVALLIFNLGILGRLQAEVIENESTLASLHLRSGGATSVQAFFYGMVPQVFGRFVALMSYRWEVALRDTILVGAVGAAGLGRVLKEQISSFDYRALSGTLLVFILLTVVIDRAGALARKSVGS